MAGISRPGTSRAGNGRPGNRRPGRLRPGALGLWGTVLTVAGGLVIALSVLGSPAAYQPIDDAFNGVVDSLRSPFWVQGSLVLNWLGHTGIFIYHGLLLVVLLLRRRPWAAVFTGMAVLSLVAITRTLKPLVDRARPDHQLIETSTAAMPSGHTTATVAAVVATGFICARLWVWCAGILLAAAVMLSRMYLDVHWLSDTIAGALVAAGVVTLLWLVLQDRCIAEQPEQRRGHGSS